VRLGPEVVGKRLRVVGSNFFLAGRYTGQVGRCVGFLPAPHAPAVRVAFADGEELLLEASEVEEAGEG